MSKFRDPEDGHLRSALSKAGICQFDGKNGTLPHEDVLELKKASMGLLVAPNLIQDLVAAAWTTGESVNLLKGAAAGENLLSLCPECDRFRKEMFSSLPTSSIPVERSINKLKYTDFGWGVGIQSGLRREAKIGAGLDVDAAEVGDSLWKEVAADVCAGEVSHVDKSEFVAEAMRFIKVKKRMVPGKK